MTECTFPKCNCPLPENLLSHDIGRFTLPTYVRKRYCPHTASKTSLRKFKYEQIMTKPNVRFKGKKAS